MRRAYTDNTVILSRVCRHDILIICLTCRCSVWAVIHARLLFFYRDGKYVRIKLVRTKVRDGKDRHPPDRDGGVTFTCPCEPVEQHMEVTEKKGSDKDGDNKGEEVGGV